LQAWPNALTFYISFSAALPPAVTIFVFLQNRGPISKFLSTRSAFCSAKCPIQFTFIMCLLDIILAQTGRK